MPRTTRRSTKAPLPAKFPSYASVEFLTVTQQENGRIIKKQSVEKTNGPIKFKENKFDTPPTLPTSLDAGSLPPLFNIDPSQPIADKSTDLNESVVSRAASVSVIAPPRHDPLTLYRPNSSNGSHTAQNSSVNSFIWKPLNLTPLYVSNVSRLQSIVAWIAFQVG